MRAHLEDRVGAASGNAYCSCPCCGSVVPASAMSADAALATLNVPPMTRQILAMLGRSVGHWVGTDRIIDALWGDREDGGPTDAENNINVHLSRARADIRQAGFAIEATWHQRRLVRITPDYKPPRLHPYSLRRKLRRLGALT